MTARLALGLRLRQGLQYVHLPGRQKLAAVSGNFEHERNVHEADVVRRIRGTPEYLQSRRDRKKVEMLFAHLKRILRIDRLRLQGPCGAHNEFLLAASAQNLRKLAKLIPMPQLAMAT